MSQRVFKLRGGHDFMTTITIYNTVRTITRKVAKPQSWFLCSARHHTVVNISVKFRKKCVKRFLSYGGETIL